MSGTAERKRRFCHRLARAFTALAFVVFGVANAAHDTESELYFRQLSTIDGLTQATITTVFQDEAGFLWFGTESGLNRYDGSTIQPFVSKRGDPASLINDFIWDLDQDADGNLWIATDGGGVAILDPVTEQFRFLRYDADSANSLSADSVRSIAIAEDGVVWLGTRDHGLNRYDPQSGDVTRHGSADAGPAIPTEATVFDVLIAADRSLWVATSTGLYRYDAISNRTSRFASDEPADRQLTGDTIMSIAELSDGAILAGTYQTGLNLLVSNVVTQRFQAEETQNTLPSNFVRDILEDSDGRIWIATSAGLALMKDRSGHFQRFVNDARDPHSLANNHTMALWQDRSEILWVGTRNAGVSSWNPRSRSFGLFRPEALDGTMVTSFATPDESTLWIGTMGQGVLRVQNGSPALDSLSGVYPQAPSIVNAMSLLIDQSGRLLVGTLTDGIHIFSTGEESAHFHANNGPAPPLRANGIMSMMQHPSGAIWVGTFGGGVSILNLESSVGKPLEIYSSNGEALASARVTAMRNGAKGDVWIATDGDGLFRYNGTTGALSQLLSSEEDAQTLSSNRLYSLHYDDEQQLLWIGTGGGGLDRLDTRSINSSAPVFRNFTITDGLADKVVYGILPDAEGLLWLSSNNGITRFDPTRERTRVFHSSHGLQSDEFNFGAYHVTANGRVHFGGSRGINAFQPAAVSTVETSPAVALTALRIDGKSVRLDSESNDWARVTAPHNHSIVSFSLAALDYVDSSKNRLRFRLKGFDESAREIDAGDLVTYTNLDAGNYELEVYAINSEGIRSAEPLRIALTVATAPWLTAWAIGIYILLAGLVIRFVASAQKRRIEQRAHIDQLTHHDKITGLANRDRFIQLLQQSISDKAPQAQQTAVLVISFDHVTRIGDTLGIQEADQTLRALANRLLHTTSSACASANEYVLSRCGNEEFAVMISDRRAVHLADILANRIQRQFRDARIIGGAKTSLAISLGRSQYPQHGRDAESLLVNARAAVHVARNSSGERYLEFSSEIRERLRSRLTMERELRHGIDNDQLEIYLQPKFDTQTIRVIGAEALIRWNHPERGMIPPTEFIPLAESTGMIVDIGRWVIGAAARQIRLWIDESRSPLKIAVNLSGIEFTTGDPAMTVASICGDLSIDPSWLEIELTETFVMQDGKDSETALQALRELGCAISIDDFGTGYSSLGYLKRFPFDKLKIDRSFVKDIDNSDGDLSICAAIIAMSHSLGLQVVAEGVETDEQLHALQQLNCDQIQGFLVGRPVPTAQFTETFMDQEPSSIATDDDTVKQRQIG